MGTTLERQNLAPLHGGLEGVAAIDDVRAALRLLDQTLVSRRGRLLAENRRINRERFPSDTLADLTA